MVTLVGSVGLLVAPVMNVSAQENMTNTDQNTTSTIRILLHRVLVIYLVHHNAVSIPQHTIVSSCPTYEL